MSFVSGSYCVCRGGSWGSDTQFARVAFRNYGTMYHRYFAIGVRLARRCT